MSHPDLPALPDPWAARRAGDHDWSGPDPHCRTCGADIFAFGPPCSYVPAGQAPAGTTADRGAP